MRLIGPRGALVSLRCVAWRGSRPVLACVLAGRQNFPNVDSFALLTWVYSSSCAAGSNNSAIVSSAMAISRWESSFAWRLFSSRRLNQKGVLAPFSLEHGNRVTVRLLLNS